MEISDSGDLSNTDSKNFLLILEKVHTRDILLFSAVWRIIRSWLSEAQKKKIFQVNKGSIQQYIAADQLEDHMVKK